MKKILFLSFVILLVFIFRYSLIAEEENYKWNRISGNWEIDRDNNNSFLIEKKAKYRLWDYGELINYNSIITYNPIENYNSIQFACIFLNPINQEISIMFPIAIKEKSNYFYAFKIISAKKNCELQFIQSKIKDTSLDLTIKKNYVIKILEEKQYNTEINKRYIIEIKTEKNKAELFIDGSKEMEAEASENIDTGRIGFSSRNVQLRIENFKIYSADKIVFEDDFSTDLIKRWKVKAEKSTQ